MHAPSLPLGWVELQLRGLILDPMSGNPVLILRERDGSIFLPIWIGPFEASAIAMAVEGVAAPRPMTHDLLRSLLEALGGNLERVEIHDLVAGTFIARLVVQMGEGIQIVDARPSDAIALALRSNAPVWATRELLAAALGSAKAVHETDEERIREWLEKASSEDLGKYSM